MRTLASPLVPLILALNFGGSQAAAAGTGAVGPELQLNTFTTEDQASPQVAVDDLGNFVVVWESETQDGSGDGVFGLRVDAGGDPVGSEFQINTYTTGAQRDPAVAVDGAGNFVVVWESDDQDGSYQGVFGQRFDAAANPLGSEFQINAYTTNDQADPAVAPDGAGGFLVVWESKGSTGYTDVFARRFDAAGDPLGDDFAVPTYTTNSQSRPRVVVDGVGNFVVVWESYSQDGDRAGVFGQRFDAAGDPVGDEFQVNTHTEHNQNEPAISLDGAGAFVVTWWTQGVSGGSDSEPPSIQARRFASDGTPADEQFQVNSYTPGTQYAPAVASDDSGRFVVAWTSDPQDGADAGIFGQRFGADGQALGREFQINTHTTLGQTRPEIASDGNGNFLVVWQSEEQDGSGEGVFAQRYTRQIFSDGFESGDTSAWSVVVP